MRPRQACKYLQAVQVTALPRRGDWIAGCTEKEMQLPVTINLGGENTTSNLKAARLIAKYEAAILGVVQQCGVANLVDTPTNLALLMIGTLNKSLGKAHLASLAAGESHFKSTPEVAEDGQYPLWLIQADDAEEGYEPAFFVCTDEEGAELVCKDLANSGYVNIGCEIFYVHPIDPAATAAAIEHALI